MHFTFQKKLISIIIVQILVIVFLTDSDNVGPLFGTKSRSSLSVSNHLKDLCAHYSRSFNFQLDCLSVTLFFRVFESCCVLFFFFYLFAQISVQRNITWKIVSLLAQKQSSDFQAWLGTLAPEFTFGKTFDRKWLVPRDHFSVIHVYISSATNGMNCK